MIRFRQIAGEFYGLAAFSEPQAAWLLEGLGMAIVSGRVGPELVAWLESLGPEGRHDLALRWVARDGIASDAARFLVAEWKGARVCTSR